MKEPREIIKTAVNEPVNLDAPFDYPVAPGRYPSYREASAQEGFQLFEYWRAIRKRLWLVIGIAVLMTTLTAIYMARKPSIYQAAARIQVDLEQNNPDLVTTDRQRPLANPDPSYFNTQLQLLGSDSLFRRVVKEHNLDANKDFQLAKAENSTSALRSILKSIGLASDAPKTNGTDDLLLKNSTVASSEDIAEAVRLAPFVDVIKKSISIEPVRESRVTTKDTRLIDVAFHSTDPNLAAYVVNGIAETFVQVNAEKRNGTSQKTNDYLEKRISDLETTVHTDEQRLVEMTQKEGILKTENDQTIVMDRLSGLNKQKLDAEFKRKEAEAAFMTVNGSPEKVRALTEEALARYTTEQENNIRVLQTETAKRIADLNSARIEKLQGFEEGAPELKQIDDQIANYRKSYENAVTKAQNDLAAFRQLKTKETLENLRTKYLQAKDQEEKIDVDFNKQFNEAQGQNLGSVNIKLLQQTITTNKGFLENLRKQQSGNDVSAKGSENNISVTEIAIPSDVVVSPRRTLTVLAALFLSTLFGMGLALFLEFLDDTIRSTEEIENYLQLPALAAIPTIDSLPKRKLLLVGADGDEEQVNSPLLISADPRSALAEAYRHLRTSILLSTAGRAPKSLLITSSLPSEGKTTTATNTAISLAQTGARVLIIDADMRRPRLHSIFNVENGVGLSSLLASELSDTDIDSAIKQDEKTKLFLMTSGPIPPNPAELIGSQQMANLLARLQARFTHVVVDSPPIASFTDGVLIASMVDGVILVVHAGHSSRQVVRRSRQLLQEIGAKIFGVVLNNVNLNTKENYYYYQSYYHHGNYAHPEEKE